MGGINVGRWLGAGAAAGALIWLVEGLASVLYMDDMQAALAAHGMTFEVTATILVLSVVISLIMGLTLIFFYAAARPRFGPGPRTAVIVALGVWLAGYFVALVGYYMLGLYPGGMLVIWGIVGLVETILAALLGGRIYREA